MGVYTFKTSGYIYFVYIVPPVGLFGTYSTKNTDSGFQFWINNFVFPPVLSQTRRVDIRDYGLISRLGPDFIL